MYIPWNSVISDFRKAVHKRIESLFLTNTPVKASGLYIKGVHQAPATATTDVRSPSSAHVHAAAASAAQRSVSNVRKLHREIRLISCLGRSAPTEKMAGQCHLTSNRVYHWENQAHYKVQCLGKPRQADETLRSLVLQLREEGWFMRSSNHIIWTLLFQVQKPTGM